jgi:protein phosphatase
MISTQRLIYCINPGCDRPTNSVGDRLCANCQTPLVYRYLWASGSTAARIKVGAKVGSRYEVITPQIWLDTQPGISPDLPEELPKEIIPFLKLYQERLHLPQPYGFARSQERGSADILLLENIPVDQAGNLYPGVREAWEKATAVRQIYWLWQILQLWTPLLELKVAGSLLIPGNLRIQGWCVRLLELVETLHSTSSREAQQPSLQDLGTCWKDWVPSSHPSVTESLQDITQKMCSDEVDLESISNQLNALLLSSASELPLNLKVAGATDVGPELLQNEDTCYPNTIDQHDSLLPQLSIVCDGIGGHQGGEVASQLAVQSVKLQIRALLTEVAEQTEVVPPDLLQQQLEASLRVVNNVICACNDEQKRQGRERMATTLVMALQVPQRVQANAKRQPANAHELYLAHVGDSRAYWITANYCQLLTLDDDVATREVRFGRSMYRKALQRPDAHALTQALGTKDAESLRVVIQRFILEEDGILLLCSDGLSDNNWVEQSWQDYAVPVLNGLLTPEEAVHHWINLANQKNGHDNTSVVLTHCRVSKQQLAPAIQPQLLVTTVAPEEELLTLEEEPELTESAQALWNIEIPEESPSTAPTQVPVKQPNRGKSLVLLIGLLLLLTGGISAGLFAWRKFSPRTFQPVCQKLPQGIQRVCPK